MRAIRFSRSWLTGRSRVAPREIEIEVEGEAVPATLYLPRRRRGGLPGWVLLHGLTRPGRAHRELTRFAAALADTPAVVLIPEIEDWKELRMNSALAFPTIRAGVLDVAGRPETAPGRTGLVAFSFGVPQAIIAATDPRLSAHLAALAGFGGYADLGRIVNFELTGRHEWEGVEYRDDPDPYGRWVIAFNHLTSVPRFAGAGDVAEALGELARIAGDRGVPAFDPSYDDLIAELRERVAEDRRLLYDLFAPRSGTRPDVREASKIARELERAIRKSSPFADPLPFIPRVRLPVHLVHGRHDRLVPFTETPRLHAAFPPGARVESTITGLFAHAEGSPVRSMFAQVRELWVFFRLLRRLLAMF